MGRKPIPEEVIREVRRLRKQKKSLGQIRQAAGNLSKNGRELLLKLPPPPEAVFLSGQDTLGQCADCPYSPLTTPLQEQGLVLRGAHPPPLLFSCFLAFGLPLTC